WFASTAIPLLAATIGPLANVMSIAALVTYWRMCLVDGATRETAAQCIWNGDKSELVSQIQGQTYRDPRWCYWLNVASLIVGFVGNIFLLFNFTNRIRYIIALPVTIVMWYVATGILIAITVSMEVHVPPIRPQQTYTQGFWYAVIAACLYMICSMLLMVNMLGYFLGHYPQHFTLTDSQRTLILQTMLFFFWLAGGAAMFAKIEATYGTGGLTWGYVNALYFADVTILTVGFGDLYPTSNIGRGLVFPYAIGGIIMLGLMVSSISKFAAEIGTEKVILRTPKLILLREEKDRFEAMRHIQQDTSRFKRWYALAMSIFSFGLLWCVGAVVFWLCERDTENKMTYFKSLYFCYVSLLTIGYGDLAPKSNLGRPFFVFWSLWAVPTMTILVSDLGETVISKFRKGTFVLADFTVLPKAGVWRGFLENHPWLLNWVQLRIERHDAKKRIAAGFQLGPGPEAELPPRTIHDLAVEEPSDEELARQLPAAIRKAAEDLRRNPKKKYSYEEWVEFTRLIRFSARKEEDRETENEEEEGLIEWDWIGEDSPMMSKLSECEFLLERLVESLDRYIKHVSPLSPRRKRRHGKFKSASESRGKDTENDLWRRRPSHSSTTSEDVGQQNERQRADESSIMWRKGFDVSQSSGDEGKGIGDVS
ncbi:hypothetical protein M433DRAFT_71167, partial [Acidomyces richmondensis BFW]